ncbi:MAG: peptide deformylase [Clostridiales bacterium]|nr:peptide deformylase [Clostridiales bacterium]
MATRNIVQRGDPSLLKRAREVTECDARLATLLDDMLATLHKSGGVGLAAPQVGVLRRVVIIEPPEQPPLELVNPEIIESEGSEEGQEGCLSVPNVWGIVARPTKVTCRAQTREGKHFTFSATGYAARIVCHETDHLDGILFTDKVIRYVDQDGEIPKTNGKHRK